MEALELSPLHPMLNWPQYQVGSSHDPATGHVTYTIERDGRRWTVSTFIHDLDRYGPLNDDDSKQRRLYHIGALFSLAMQGKADGELQ
jgi:hypothetical protein